MPKGTFFNLSPAKRERLLQAAVNEFARKPCGEVSINRIIREAEIPRGSFYQYFYGKTDLFQYVLRLYSEQMEALILRGLKCCGGDPLELPLVLYDSVLRHIRDQSGPSALLPSILRQNAGMEPELLDSNAVLELAGWNGLCIETPQERLCLLDLLFSSVKQSLLAVCYGKLTPEESRERLAIKTAIIRKGVENTEKYASALTPGPPCSRSY